MNFFLEDLWGPHSVDCFAKYYNHKLHQYFSRFWNPNSSGVDFFFQSLRGENCLVVPPVGIIPRVLRYLKSQQAVGTLVVPLQPSSHFWPLIAHQNSCYFVALTIHIGNEVLTHGRNFNSLLGSDLFTGNIIAFRLNFTDYSVVFIYEALALSLGHWPVRWLIALCGTGRNND